MSDIKSGKHLAAVRSWIQWNAVNGDRVTWGSDDELRLKRPITVSMLEEIAQRVADAMDHDGKTERIDRLLKERLQLQIEVDRLKRKLARGGVL